jgi:hypothetical protein
MFRETEIAISDLVLRPLRITALKWRLSNTKFEGKHPDRPDVDGLVVGDFAFLSAHFWWQVIECAAEGLPLITRGVARPAKISKFYCFKRPQQILRLYVPVYNVFAVYVLQRLCHLVYYISCLWLLIPTMQL